MADDTSKLALQCAERNSVGEDREFSAMAKDVEQKLTRQ